MACSWFNAICFVSAVDTVVGGKALKSRPTLTLVSPAKTLKRATSKSTPFISGGYEYDRRHFEFARQHDHALGELERIRIPMSYSAIGLRVVGVLVALAVIGWMFL